MIKKNQISNAKGIPIIFIVLFDLISFITK